MKKRFQFLLLCFALIITNAGFSQGTIRGSLVDAETQEPLIGGVVQIEGTGAGAVTDIDGTYSIQISAGSYTVLHTYIGYQEKAITEVEVIDGEVNSLGTIALGIGGEGSELEAVVVTAFVQKNTEAGLLNFQRESSKIVDAISAESIARSTDNDVAAVVRRVPGVTIESGKYVYVRGLGDRYSKSILNGLAIPGLDPNKNSVQMDIFPANIVDNIVVFKTFSPDLPGDFTGGMVDVVTKDFPVDERFNVSIGSGVNTETTFNNNYVNNESGGFQDLFGFGKQTRRLPFAKTFEPVNATELDVFYNTASLSPEVNPETVDALPNHKLSASYGNQIDLNNNNRLGFNAAVNYQNNYNFRPNTERNNLVINPAADGYQINAQDERNGVEGYNEGLLNGIVGVALKNDNNKYALKLLHTRTGENSSTVRTNIDTFNDQAVHETTLDYFQRSLTNAILTGENYFGNESELTYSVSGTYSTVDNPERTSTAMEYENLDPSSTTLLFTSGSTFFNKQWRELSEYNLNGKLDYLIPLNTSVDGTNIKFGAAANTKERDFETFTVAVDKSANTLDLIQIPNRDVDQLLNSDFLFAPGREGYAIESVQVDSDNAYNSDMTILGAYGMTDYRFSEKLKFIGGLRVENAIMNYAGQVRRDGLAEQFDGETLNSTQLLPSANFVFEPMEFMNLRASYNRTLARPSFKEKSGAIIYDAIQDQRYYGNIDLTETEVANYDFRWEYFFTDNEVVSISPFYKTFSDPIELTFITANEVRPFNKEDASVLGFEFEGRKNLGFLGEGAWQDMSINTNFTWVDSSIPLTENEELKYSTNNLAVPQDRDMLGQAPYSVNANLGYRNPYNGWEGNLGYNVKGPTLFIVGIANIPDVYEDPFHNLDFKVSKRLGGDNGRSKVSLSARNLLNDNIEYYYDFPNIDQNLATYNSYNVGQAVSASFSFDVR